MGINFDQLITDLEAVDTKKVLSVKGRTEAVSLLQSGITRQEPGVGYLQADEFARVLPAVDRLIKNDALKSLIMCALLKQCGFFDLYNSSSAMVEAIRILPLELLQSTKIYDQLSTWFSRYRFYRHYSEDGLFKNIAPEKFTFVLSLIYPQLHLIKEETAELGPLLGQIPADYAESFLLILHDDSPFNPNSKTPLKFDDILLGVRNMNEEQIGAFCLVLKEKICPVFKYSQAFHDLITSFNLLSFKNVAPIFMSNLDKMKDSLSFSEYRTQELVSFLMKLKEDYPEQQFLSLQDAIPASIKNIDDFNALMAYPEDKQVLFDRLAENLALVKRLAPILAGDTAGRTVIFMQSLKGDAFEAFFTRLPSDKVLQKAWSIACMADENQRVQAAVKAATPTGVLSFLKGGQPSVANEDKIKVAVKKTAPTQK